MRSSALLLFSLVLLLAFTSFSQVSLNQPVPTDPNVRIGKLPNGLTYYIRRNGKPEHKVELRLAVNAGSILERDDQQGLAHFMEHMNFNGTTHFKKNELVSYLQSIGVRFGADLNAYTSFDETVYILPIPTDKPELIDKGLLVLSDWAAGATLDQEEINKERGVVLEELRLGRGAAQRMQDKYFPRLLSGSQYAVRLPIGKKEILDNFDRKSLVDFFETWYRPDLEAVVVVGDVDVNVMEGKIKAQFSDLKAKRPIVERPEFPIPDTKGTLVDVETDKEAQVTTAEILYKKPKEKEVKTQADLRRELVKGLFNGMFNARLNEIRQSPQPPFAFAGGGFETLFRGKSVYGLFGAASPENISSAISTLLTETRRVQAFGFTPGEFEREKERYLTRVENQFKEKDKTESGEFATEYVANFLTHDPIPGADFDLQFAKNVLPSITLKEVNELSKNTATDDNRAIIVTGLAKDDVKYPTEPDILALLKEAETAELKPYTETVNTEPLVKDLPNTAKVTSEKTDKNLGITYWELSNGVKVVLKPTDFKSDEILMRAFSPGGLSLEPDEKALSGNFLSPYIGEAGLKNITQVELGKRLAGKKANVSLSVSNEYELLNGDSTPKDFETMLQLAYLKFTSVDFDKAEFDSFLSKEKMFLPNLLNNPRFYFNNEVSKIMSQNHPRAFGFPTTEQLEKVKLDDMQAIYKDRFADASDFTFVFVGTFDNEKIKPLILQYLGNLPTTRRTETWKDMGIRPPSGKLDKTIYRGVDPQSVVQIIFTGSTPYDRDESRDLAAVGELLTIKLIEILREEKGGVYGVGASGGLAKVPYERFNFSISFPCGPENVKALTDAALGELTKIQNGQIDDKDVAKVKEARLVGLKENFKNNNYWASEISRDLQQSLPILSLEDAEARTNAINKGDLQKVAKKYLNPDARIQLVLMPEASSPKEE